MREAQYLCGLQATYSQFYHMINSSKNIKPGGMLGIRHVALFVKELEVCVNFYVDIMGMKIEWQPDADNVYLTNDGDVFALHRVDYLPQGQQRLDHIGFVLKTPQDVDNWYAYFVENGVKITEAPKTHRDNSRGFYCLDAVGHLLELIYHPPIIKSLTA